MIDVQDSDLTRGPEVKWYVGGIAQQQTVTASGVGPITLTSPAVNGLIVASRNGVQVDYTPTGTEASGITAVTIPGAVSGDQISLYYVSVPTGGALDHIASAQDFNTSTTASSTTTAVHGQQNKIVSVGVSETTGSFSMLQITGAFKALFVGARTAAGTGKVWSNKVTGFKKVGCLVGVKLDAMGNPAQKWGLIGVSFTGNNQTFPTENIYTDSFNVSVDYLIKWESDTALGGGIQGASTQQASITFPSPEEA